MTAVFHIVATVLGVFAVLEGIRSLTLLRANDPGTSSSAAATGLLFSLCLVFVVMARIDG